MKTDTLPFISPHRSSGLLASYHPWFPKVLVIVPGMKMTRPVLIIILIAVIIIAFSIYKLRIIT